MENSNSQPLAATESFSYSWLTDTSSYRSYTTLVPKDQNFNFDVSSAVSSSVALAHADEIFSDGHIMPVYVERSNKGRPAISVPPSPVPLVANNNESFLLHKWRKTSKRILRKCFGFVSQTLGGSRKSSRVDDLERKVCEVRSWSNSVEASPRPSSAYSVMDWNEVRKPWCKVDLYYNGLKKVKSWSNLPESGIAVAPQLSPSNSSNGSCHVESSIHEAILYCKRSIEK